MENTFKKHHAARLLNLAAFLRKLPSRQFDLGYWVSKGDPVKNECGTVACACGWAASIPSFRRAGLGYDTRKGDMTFTEGLPHTFYGWRAIEEFFGLDGHESDHLFSEDGYPVGRRGPKSVALRIERFVKRKQKETGK